MRDYLMFLCRFPPGQPFLLSKRREKNDKSLGAPPLEYRFDNRCVQKWRLETKPMTLTASMNLEDLTEEDIKRYPEHGLVICPCCHRVVYMPTLVQHVTLDVWLERPGLA